MDGYATLILVRSNNYDSKQKILQFLLLIFFPIIGALLVWHLDKGAQNKIQSSEGYDNSYVDSYIGHENHSSSDDGGTYL
jgi:hypothetical protein